MIVLDASAAIEWVLRGPAAAEIDTVLGDPGQEVGVPHLWSVETAQVLRRYARLGEMSPERARSALAILAETPAARYPHEPLLDRAWQLRDNATMYDAVYLVLAETLDAPLVTGDGKLADVPGCRATVHLLGRQPSADG
ncbi:MAG: type II toxin-antitoxin system VapC family toxin [Desertimonas sp.]